ncbi:MAG: hypothetical protein J6K03_04040, partial [Oscillospiraceae bacterium]|nr:hypothetical protein [Oscillospiraceae bacterium]
LELGFFMVGQRVDCDGQRISLMDGNYEYVSVGYSVNGNQYQQVSADPQIIFFDVDETTGYVLLSFGERLNRGVQAQIFYRAEGEAFSSENVTKVYDLPFASSNLIIELPKNEYDALRIDIEGDFILTDVQISQTPMDIAHTFEKPFDVLHVLVLFCFFGFVGWAFVRWYYAEKNARRLSAAELLFCLGCFVYYFLWASLKRLNYAPDEQMRFDVTQFLFEHGRLPVGDELLSDWGFSYAHLPTVLCNWLGYFCMKIISVFTLHPRVLLLAARLPNVLCGVGAVYYTIKIGKLMFKTPARWIMVVVMAFMPQFVFLSSYINNDMVAFFGVTMIVYAWVLGMKYDWNFANTALLAIGISVCALAYYNSYIWILFSVIFFYAIYFRKHPGNYKDAAKYTAFIAGVVFLLIGYTFIRHLVVYNSLLGFEVTAYYGENFAIDALKPSNRFTMLELGIPLMTMLFDPIYEWLEITWVSSIGNFGYMQYRGPDIVYEIVTAFVAIGGVALLVRVVVVLLVRGRKPDPSMTLFWGLVALAAVVTVALSIYNSYTQDFQPQGRYCYPAFLSLVFFLAKGYEWLLSLLRKNEHKYAVVSAICTGFAAFSLFMFWTVYLPS